MTKHDESKKPKRIADRVIRGVEKILVHHRFLSKLYFIFFQKMTLDEFSMIDLPPGASVINIGCGSFPHTIILLARERGWMLTGVDKDKKAVENAQRVIKEYTCNDTIKIIHGEGRDVDVVQFDLIILSHGIEPKKEILEHLGNQMKKDALLLYRTVSNKLQGIYGGETIPTNLKIKASYDRIDGITSYLLMRNETNK